VTRPAPRTIAEYRAAEAAQRRRDVGRSWLLVFGIALARSAVIAATIFAVASLFSR